jgi:hypothetical protein
VISCFPPAHQIIAFAALCCLSLSLWCVVSEVFHSSPTLLLSRPLGDSDDCASGASFATRVPLPLRPAPSHLPLHAVHSLLQRGPCHETDSSQEQVDSVRVPPTSPLSYHSPLLFCSVDPKTSLGSVGIWLLVWAGCSFLSSPVGLSSTGLALSSSLPSVGWMASASRPLYSGHFDGATSDRWIDRMTSMRDLLESGKFRRETLSQFWHVQVILPLFSA